MKKTFEYVYLSFGISIVIVVIVSYILSGKISSIINKSSWVEHTHKVKNQILQVQLDLFKAESAQREYLLTENDSLLAPLRKTQISMFREIDSLRFLTRDNEEQQSIIVKLKQAVSQRYQVLYQTMHAEKDDQLSEFLNNSAKGKQAMANFTVLANQMNEVENKLLTERTKDKEFYENEAPKYLILVLTISCVFQIISFFIILKAFRKRAQYEAILENKIKELNIANAEMEQIAFVASHDLQEPLRKIRIFSDRLLHLSSGLSEDGEIITSKILTASKRMQELISDLVSYTRVTKNEEIIQLVDIKACVEKVCHSFQQVIDKQGAIIDIEELPVIKGYYNQIVTLFSNLIDNALKFSKTGCPASIKISWQKADGKEVGSEKKFEKITISDNGIGFKKEYSEKIFVIFQRLDNTNSSLSGKGIGLAICKRIMINHSGQIMAASQPDEGAVFNLYFPENT